jgi:hypothetical protein
MKKIIAIFSMLAAFSIAYATAAVDAKPQVKASEVYLPVGNTGQMLSVQDLSLISVKDFQNLTGKKMNLVDRLGFKIAQKKLRNSINTDGTFNKKKVEKFFNSAAEGGSGFHAGGFFLGLILGLIGVLIAYLIKDDKKKARVKWAWIGWVIWLVVYGVILLA